MGKEKFIRKISKYDIDRGMVDFNYLKKEKVREVTENNQIKKLLVEKQEEEKKL